MAERGRVTPEMIAAADAAYTPLTPFSEWRRGSVSELMRPFENALEVLLSRRESVDERIFAAAQKYAIRSAAVDTGALENLYSTDRGFTAAVAANAAIWMTEATERGPDVTSLIEAQIEGYELALDLATSVAEFSEASIRHLHEVVCAPQETHPVFTDHGLQHQPLAKGSYKTQANHAFDTDGNLLRAHAPVIDTSSEMESFVAQLSAGYFAEGHPVLQAAYAHYGLVHIHPFEDGNGRVARLLASIFTLRATSTPLVVFADERTEYRGTLGKADEGDVRPFVAFVAKQAEHTLTLTSQQIATSAQPDTSSTLDRISSLYVAQRGLSHSDVDNAAHRLASEAEELLTERLSALEGSAVGVQFSSTNDAVSAPDGYRTRLDAYSQRVVHLRTERPAASLVQITLRVIVNSDLDASAELVLQQVGTSEWLAVEIPSVYPMITTNQRLVIDAWVEEVLRSALDRLAADAETAARAEGYSVPPMPTD